jgi:putative FmdB family regulatory protein
VPTYQYACTECGHAFEQFQRFTDDALTECPECHGRLRKLFNAVGVVFKGSGFYRTDSRSGPEKSDKPATAGAGADSGSNGSGSTGGSGGASESAGASSSAAKPAATTAS